jgi:hypothetical protein
MDRYEIAPDTCNDMDRCTKRSFTAAGRGVDSVTGARRRLEMRRMPGQLSPIGKRAIDKWPKLPRDDTRHYAYTRLW